MSLESKRYTLQEADARLQSAWYQDLVEDVS